MEGALKKKLAIAAALVIAALVLWIFETEHESTAAHHAGSTKAAGAGNDNSSSAVIALPPSTIASGKASPDTSKTAATANAAGPFPSMPPVGAPMRLVYRQMKEQADAGDPIAQCRLAHELMRCKRLPQEIERSHEAEERLRDQPRVAQLVAMMRQQLATDKAVCEDFTPDPGDEPWRFMLRAGLSGNQSAALQFVVSPPLDRTAPVADLDGWQAYREYAPLLLQRAIAAGDSRAYQIAVSFARMHLYGADLEPNDPVQFAAYYLALMPLAAPSYRTFMQDRVQSFHLSEADLAQAQARAASLASALRPPPDGQPVVGNNIIGYGRWNDGAECEH